MRDCDFANARIGARRARLRGEQGLRELVASPDLETRLDLVLAGGARRGRILLERGPGRLRAVELLLADEVRTESARIDADLGPRARRLLRALLLLDDADSLKVVLRAILRGEPAERAAARAAPTPALPFPVLRDLAAAPTPAAAAEALARLGHPLAAALRDALPALREAPPLLRLETALDAGAFRAAEAAARGIGAGPPLVRRQIAIRADHLNVATLLALGEGARAEGLFLPGGRMDEARFLAFAADGPEERREGLAAFLGPVRGKQRALPEELAVPARAAQLLAQSLERALQREARRDPLSLAVPIAYLAARRGEARRVRALLRCAEFGLPAGDQLDLLEA
ncbi:MAG TPA: V-type ATPase subunit [Anaeromyxobacteraceae bacterium]